MPNFSIIECNARLPSGRVAEIYSKQSQVKGSQVRVFSHLFFFFFCQSTSTSQGRSKDVGGTQALGGGTFGAQGTNVHAGIQVLVQVLLTQSLL